MLLLGIDTCGATGSLALARLSPDATLAPLAQAELPGRTTAAMLVPELEQLLHSAALTPTQLSAIVVVDGPGSFTGIRIGLSTAKALSEALAIPLFPISRLRVLSSTHGNAPVLLDAGRGEFYYRAGNQPPNENPDESLKTLNELDALPSLACVSCEERVAASIPGVTLVPAPTALDALRTALPELLPGVNKAQRTDVATLDGRYLRRSDLYRQAQPLS